MAKAPASKQVLSLAQGIVHWAPPPAATALASKLLAAGQGVHGYGLAGVGLAIECFASILQCALCQMCNQVMHRSRAFASAQVACLLDQWLRGA
jgi:hypothetical protein